MIDGIFEIILRLEQNIAHQCYDRAMKNCHTHPKHQIWQDRCGLNLHTVSADSIEFRLAPLPHNINLSGTLHGGITASTSLEAALQLGAHHGHIFTPVSMRTSYLYGGKAAESKVICHRIRQTRSYLFARCDIFDDEDNLLTCTDIILRNRSPEATQAVHAVPPLERFTNISEYDFSAAQTMLNQRQTEFASGLALIAVRPGYCHHQQQLVPATTEPDGRLALGAIIKAADDNASLCSHLMSDKTARLSATLSLSLSIHALPTNAPVDLYGQTMTVQDGVAHNRLLAVDSVSQQTLLTGELCHLLR